MTKHTHARVNIVTLSLNNVSIVEHMITQKFNVIRSSNVILMRHLITRQRNI